MITTRGNDHSDKAQKLILVQLGRRKAINNVARMMKPGEPAVRPLPHFKGIKPQSHDLLFGQRLLQAKGIARLPYLPNPGFEMLEANALRQGLADGC